MELKRMALFALPILSGMAFGAFLLLGVPCSDAKIVSEHIYFIPAGTIDKKIVQAIKNNLPSTLPISVSIEILPSEKLAETAYDGTRKQYNAEVVMDGISRRVSLDSRVECALIVTDSDLYSQDMNYVFGAANPKKLIGIISVARFKNEFYGLRKNDNLMIERAVKEAMLELGQVWGLSRCSNHKCVMYSSSDIADTDKKKNAYCHECEKSVRRLSYEPLIKGPLF